MIWIYYTTRHCPCGSKARPSRAEAWHGDWAHGWYDTYLKKSASDRYLKTRLREKIGMSDRNTNGCCGIMRIYNSGQRRFLCGSSTLHSTSTWMTDNSPPHIEQRGCSVPVNTYVCVAWVWPIRSLQRVTSIILSRLSVTGLPIFVLSYTTYLFSECSTVPANGYAVSSEHMI